MSGEYKVFGKSKKIENRYVIAIKDLKDTLGALKNQSLSLPFEKELYTELLNSGSKTIDTTKELSGFIKTANKSKNEVKHYWEGLITQGYSLMIVNYDKKQPAIERLLDVNRFKFVCRA